MKIRHDTKLNKPARQRVFAAFFAALLVLVPALLSIDGSCFWGDDHAAYISEGIAIADGCLEEQTRLNAIMHPAVLAAEAQGGELLYVWGYPLLLSLVYSAVGFDRMDFSTLVYYKLPSVFSLALLAAVLFLFYRRRFGGKLSFFLSLLFCCCSEFFSFLNSLYSDLVFLFFVMLSLYLCEQFLYSETDKFRYRYAVALGFSLWYMYEIRLNGVSVLFLCILAHLLVLWKDLKNLYLRRASQEFLPYLVFALLVFLSQAVLGRATPNTSDLGNGITAVLFLENIKSYLSFISQWFALLWNSLLISPLYSVLRRFTSLVFEDFSALRSVLVWLSMLLCVLGLLKPGKPDRPYGVYIVVYLLLACTLPYTQGLRYIYPLLPLLLLFTAHGFLTLLHKLPLPSSFNILHRLSPLVLAVCCFLLLYPHISASIQGERGIHEVEVIASPSDVYSQNSYSACAKEVYRYIRSETEKDCTIAFFAPRALYLNTERLSIRPGVNGHSINEADYCLRYLRCGEYPVDQDPGPAFQLVFSNDEFSLYKRLPSSANSF